MASAPPVRRSWRFGPFRLESAPPLLMRDGEVVPLNLKALETLRALVESAGTVVEKDALIKAVWPDTFVEESNLAHNISLLRKTLGSDPHERPYIQTIPKRGYRFIAEILEEVPAAAPAKSPAEPPAPATLPEVRPEAVAPHRGRLGRRTAIPAVLIVIAMGGAVFHSRLQNAYAPLAKSVAVLPLQNLSGDPEQEYFADGLTEALIGDLAKISGLRVISRTSAMHYKGSKKRLPEIARELNVDAVVEGSVVKAGDRIHIRTQLIRAANDEHLWTESYDRDVRDVPSLYGEVAQSVASKVRVEISQAEKARLAVAHPVNRKAFEAWLRGRHYWNKRTEEAVRKAITWFRTSLDEDAAYAPAYAGLADCYNQLGTVIIGGEPAAVARPLAIAAASKALEIDDNLAEAHAALAFARLYDWEWERAGEAFRRAIELNPSYAPVRIWHSTYLIYRQKPLQALQEVSAGQELDPLSLIVKTQTGWIHKFADRDEEAVPHYLKVLETDPNFTWALYQLGQSYLNLGRFHEAIGVLEKGVRASQRSASLVATLGEAYALAGRRADAEALLDELLVRSRQRYIPPAVFVYLYLGLGDHDEAFRWLEAAYRERSNLLAGLAVWPSRRLFPSFCSDPRFKNFLLRVGLAQ